MFPRRVHSAAVSFFFLSLCGLSGTLPGALADTSGTAYPWTFDNDLFGGPDFWGLVSKEWRMCRVGRMQSPINIDPRRLLFDPHLGRFSISKNPVEAHFRNTGQFPLLTVTNQLHYHSTNGSGGRILTSSSSASAEETDSAAERHTTTVVNISGGPAFPYTYQLHQVILHFGSAREDASGTSYGDASGVSAESAGAPLVGGSEHTVDRVRFPAEIQLIAYNSDLYENFTDAMRQPKGLLAIAIIVDIGQSSNPELRRLALASKYILHKNKETRIKKFHAANLLPKTEHYVTYDGSLTYPGCYESVVWMVMNNPIYATREDLALFNEMEQREKPEDPLRGQGAQPPPPPPLRLIANYRPLKPLNGRLLRTNINVKYKSRTVSGSCPSNIYLDMGYRSNPRRSIGDGAASDTSTTMSARRSTRNASTPVSASSGRAKSLPRRANIGPNLRRKSRRAPADVDDRSSAEIELSEKESSEEIETSLGNIRQRIHQIRDGVSEDDHFFNDRELDEMSAVFSSRNADEEDDFSEEDEKDEDEELGAVSLLEDINESSTLLAQMNHEPRHHKHNV